MGAGGFERGRAIEAYAETVKALRDDAGAGYDPHERTLLVIGFAAGWDALRYALDRLSASIHDLD